MSERAAARAMSETGEPGPKSSRAARYLPAAIVLAGLALGYLMGWHQYLTLEQFGESRDTLSALVARHPLAAPAIFFGVYVLAVAFSFPAASVLTIFGGFLFGWALGGALVVVAATTGACIIFLVARSALGDTLRRRIGGRAAGFAKGFEDNAFSALLVLRLAPVFPFFVVNVAPALFNVGLRTFAAATFLGILPGTFAYAYLGEGVDSVLRAAQAAGREPRVADLVTTEITIAFAALALVAAGAAVVRTRWLRRG
jgi:uncharacterized membrane protein YdjX (TVP38/TMEM64 family)